MIRTFLIGLFIGALCAGYYSAWTAQKHNDQMFYDTCQSLGVECGEAF